ncbi:MAG: biopolymer transporter ExbD [Candidatus Eisenbacteria bacterium]
MIPLGRGRSVKERTAEIDMVPMMNLFTVLVPVLLLAAVFANITVLELEIPPVGSGESGVNRSAEPTPLNLVVIVSEEGVTVGGNGGFLPSVLREGGVYDVERVGVLLAGVKEKHPGETRVTVAAESGIPYEEVVELMDLCRAEGFADIALSALHDGPPAAGGGER